MVSKKLNAIIQNTNGVIDFFLDKQSIMSMMNY